MRNLILTGNGFDLAHGLPTRYEDFRLYLKDCCSESNNAVCLPQSRMSPDGGEDYDTEEVVRLLLHAISQAEPNGEEWSEVEASVGRLEYAEFLDIYGLDEEEEDDFKEVHLNKVNAKELSGAIIQIPEYFSDWVETIEIEKATSIESFQVMIDPAKDLFLNFNYTPTLQELYGVKEVCHIHGKQGEVLLFGHGNDKDYCDYYMTHYIGAEEYLTKVDQSLKKDTTQAIESHHAFFDQLSDPSKPIDKIYSYGFSFSEVDEVYMRKICQGMSTHEATWLFNDYDSEKNRSRFQEVVRKCGFQGQFDTYHIEK